MPVRGKRYVIDSNALIAVVIAIDSNALLNRIQARGRNLTPSCRNMFLLLHIAQAQRE